MNQPDFRHAYTILLQARIAAHAAQRAVEILKNKIDRTEREFRKSDEYQALKNETQRRDFLAEKLDSLNDSLEIAKGDAAEYKLELEIARDQVEMHNGLIELMKMPAGCGWYAEIEPAQMTDAD